MLMASNWLMKCTRNHLTAFSFGLKTDSWPRPLMDILTHRTPSGLPTSKISTRGLQHTKLELTRVLRNASRTPVKAGWLALWSGAAADQQGVVAFRHLLPAVARTVGSPVSNLRHFAHAVCVSLLLFCAPQSLLEFPPCILTGSARVI